MKVPVAHHNGNGKCKLMYNRENPRTSLLSEFGGFLHGALNRNRTDDLILTMDALYRLSYKGLFGVPPC